MKKKIFAVIILLIILASIPIGVYLVKRQQEIRLRAAPATVLSLIPATTTKNVNEVFTVDVRIETGPNIVMGADVFLTFDPQVLDAQSVSMGTFLSGAQEIRSQINNDIGSIAYALYTLAENARSGTGTLVQISFRGRAPGTGSVTFDPLTSVADINEGEVLSDTVPGSYLIAEAAPTATPTESPTPTPTGGVGGPEPTATPTPGGGTPTETPTPTPTGGVGGPEPTATLTPTPTTVAGTTPTSTPTPMVSPEELPETGIFTSTLLFLLGGGIVLVLGFLRLLLYF